MVTPRPSLAGLLVAQAGVVTRAQARAVGCTTGQIRAQLAAGRWQQVHRGTYATFTGALPPLARLWAAVLTCGDGATLSHRTAAWLYGLSATGGGSGRGEEPIEVTVPAGRKVRAVTGVRVHRSRRLDLDRHPALSPPRTRLEATLLDLAGVEASLDDAIGLVARACQGRRTTPARVRAVLLARRGGRWRRELLAALGDVAAGAESLLELRYLRHVERAHGLPVGERQARVASGRRASVSADPRSQGQRTQGQPTPGQPTPGQRAQGQRAQGQQTQGQRTQGQQTQLVDVRYRRLRTRVELDGRLGHEEARARWRDYARDNAGVVAGDVTLRYGFADVAGRPCEVAGQVADTLRARGWSGHPRRCGPACRLPDPRSRGNPMSL